MVKMVVLPKMPQRYSNAKTMQNVTLSRTHSGLSAPAYHIITTTSLVFAETWLGVRLSKAIALTHRVVDIHSTVNLVLSRLADPPSSRAVTFFAPGPSSDSLVETTRKE